MKKTTCSNLRKELEEKLKKEIVEYKLDLPFLEVTPKIDELVQNLIEQCKPLCGDKTIQCRFQFSTNIKNQFTYIILNKVCIYDEEIVEINLRVDIPDIYISKNSKETLK